MENTTTRPFVPPPDEVRQKYIRTFEADADVLQKGGTPGLAPFPGTSVRHGVSLVPHSFGQPARVEPESVPVLMNKSVPVPTSDISVPIPETVAPLPPPVPLQPPPQSPVISLETYSSDFSNRMKETHASTATVLAAEQDAATLPPEPAEPVEEESKNTSWIFIAISVVLLIAGGAGVYLTLPRFIAAVTPVMVAPSAAAPIFFDSQSEVAGSGTALLQAVAQAAGAPLPINTVKLLSFAKGATTTMSIFSALPLHAPGMLVRNSSDTGGMTGIVHVGTGQSVFFILSVDSYSATFSGMLSWEQKMPNDMSGLFPAYSTASSTAVSAKAGWRDEVVDNHDVRIYRDLAGRSILLYGYWDQSTLVIARDYAAFGEILGRLATSHTQP